MERKTFGARLRELREAAGLTQRDLADAAGVSLRGVAQWEQGLREPSWSNAVALAAALGVDCRAFLEAPAGDGKPRGRGRPPKAQETQPPGRKGKAK